MIQSLNREDDDPPSLQSLFVVWVGIHRPSIHPYDHYLLLALLWVVVIHPQIQYIPYTHYLILVMVCVVIDLHCIIYVQLNLYLLCIREIFVFIVGNVEMYMKHTKVIIVVIKHSTNDTRRPTPSI